MNRLLIILALAYAAGRILGARSMRRELAREAEARRVDPGPYFRLLYDDGLAGEWIPSSSKSQEVSPCPVKPW